jgi:hypothetical protein
VEPEPLMAGYATDLAAGDPDLATVGALEPPTLAESRVPTVGCPADDLHEEKCDLVAVGREDLASSATEAWPHALGAATEPCHCMDDGK